MLYVKLLSNLMAIQVDNDYVFMNHECVCVCVLINLSRNARINYEYSFTVMFVRPLVRSLCSMASRDLFIHYHHHNHHHHRHIGSGCVLMFEFDGRLHLI